MEQALQPLTLIVSDRLSTLLFALLASLLFAGPYVLFEKTRIVSISRIFTLLMAAFEVKLNRPQRSENERKIRGAFILFMALFFASYAGRLIDNLPPSLYKVGFSVFIVACFIPLRPLIERSWRVAQAMASGNEKDCIAALGNAARRQSQQMDKHASARASIEYLAENFCDHVLTPAMWYILLGMPGLLMARAINSMDRVVGYRTPHYAAYGWAAARLDDAVCWLPARLSGFLLCIAAFFAPFCHPLSAFASMFKDAARFRSPNSGWPIAAIAGALNVALGGPRVIKSSLIEDPWAGSGNAKVTARNVKHAALLVTIAASALMLMLACLLLLLT